MAEFAKVGLAAVPACPSCRNRLSNLPLDELSAGDIVQCLVCSDKIRIPQQTLDRLRQQRDALQAENEVPLWQRITRLVRRWFGA